MSMSEQTANYLVTVAENQQKVYNAGYEQGKAEGNTDLLQYATFENGSIFRAAIFPDDLLDVKFKITGVKANAQSLSFAYCFAYCNATSITIDIGSVNEAGVSCKNTFMGCKSLKTITFTSGTILINLLLDMFSNSTKLEKINGELDLSKTTNTNGAFSKCYALKEIRFVKNSIKKSLSFNDSADLTDNSVQSIVDGYADMTGQTAPVLTVHPDVKARIVADDEKEDTDTTKRNWLKTLTSKNVTLA